jgi:hypothetical protein
MRSRISAHRTHSCGSAKRACPRPLAADCSFLETCGRAPHHPAHGPGGSSTAPWRSKTPDAIFAPSSPGDRRRLKRPSGMCSRYSTACRWTPLQPRRSGLGAVSSTWVGRDTGRSWSRPEPGRATRSCCRGHLAWRGRTILPCRPTRGLVQHEGSSLAGSRCQPDHTRTDPAAVHGERHDQLHVQHPFHRPSGSAGPLQGERVRVPRGRLWVLVAPLPDSDVTLGQSLPTAGPQRAR